MIYGAAGGGDSGADGTIYMITKSRKVFFLDWRKNTLQEICDTLKVWKEKYNPFFLLERASARPGDGNATMFEFGRNYGKMEMALIAAHINYELVQATTWQLGLGLGGSYAQIGDTKSQAQARRKRAHKAKAEWLFKDRRFTLKTQDGILIAEFNWRRLFGRNFHEKANSIRVGTGIVRTTTRVRR